MLWEKKKKSRIREIRVLGSIAVLNGEVRTSLTRLTVEQTRRRERLGGQILEGRSF
jgi:hypothetical protein